MNFMYNNSKMTNFMICPREVMKQEDLPDGAKILYMHLLDRARLSMQNPGWTDPQGRVYLTFPITSLGKTLHKGSTAVKQGLSILEKAGLIQKVHRGIGLPDQIYVKLPQDGAGRKDPLLPSRQTEKRPWEGRKSVPQTDGKASGNYNKISYKEYTYQEGESL